MSKEKKYVVISLFNGLGCIWIALERAGIKVSQKISSEVDKHAIKANDHNYPETIQIGDVRKINVIKDDKGQPIKLETENGIIDLLDDEIILGGGSPCFPKDTKVIARDEIKNIQDVKVGDYVLTHKNRFKKVLKTGGEPKKKIISVFAQGLPPIKTTSDHPFYIREMSRKWDNDKRTSYRYFSDPIWKKAVELKKGDFVGLPILNTSENLLNITKEEAYIIGRYIADGHTRKDYRTNAGRPNDRMWQVILSIGKDKVSKFKNKVTENHFSCYKHGESVYRCVFSSKRLVEIVEQHCGMGAINKHLSMTLLNLPKDILSTLIDGFLDGDGSMKDEKYSITTISENLCLTLGLAITKVYRVGFQYHFHKVPKTFVIEGRTVNQHDNHQIRFDKTVRKQCNYKIIDDIVWLPVKKTIEENYSEQVYNLEVEEDNSYTAGGVMVHNCQSFSFAGKMKGMSTKDEQEVLTLEHYMKLKEQEYEFEGQSYLFWEYMRLKNELNPKYFLLENVIMVEKWRKVLSRSIGVNPIRINSSLLTAQNRDRYYWTDIYSEPAGLFGDMECKIPQPKDKGILLKHILQKDVAEKYYLKNPKFGFNGMDINAKGNTLRTGGKASQTDKHNYDIIKIDVDGNPKANQDKASCFTAGGHSGGNHSDMDLLMYQLPHGTNPGGEVAKDGKTPSMTTSSWQHNNLIVNKNENTEGCIKFGRSEEAKKIRKNSKKTHGKDYSPFAEKQITGIDYEKMNTLTTAVNKDNLIMQTSPQDNLGRSEWTIDQKNTWKYEHTCGCGKKYIGTMLDKCPNPKCTSGGGTTNEIDQNTLKRIKKSKKEVKQINPSTESNGQQPYQQNRIYDTDGISPALCADKSDLLIQGCDYRTDEGLRVRDNGKTGTLAARARNDESCGQLAKINSRIRRLTPVECCRLQNIPDNYFYDKDGKNVISDSQIYRCVGNGWSCDVVAHIFSFI